MIGHLQFNSKFTFFILICYSVNFSWPRLAKSDTTKRVTLTCSFHSRLTAYKIFKANIPSKNPLFEQLLVLFTQKSTNENLSKKSNPAIFWPLLTPGIVSKIKKISRLVSGKYFEQMDKEALKHRRVNYKYCAMVFNIKF